MSEAKKQEQTKKELRQTVLSEEELVADLKTNILQMNSELGVNVGFDIACREMEIAGRKTAMYYVNGFTKDLDLLQIMKSLDAFEKEAKDKGAFDIDRLMDHHLFYLQVTTEAKLRQVYYHILSGRVAFLFDGEKKAIVVEARQMPGRQPQEPDIERVVRGSRDGFTETIVTNTALIRRRVRDPRLRFKLLQVGRRSQTDVAVAYIEDIASPELVQEITDRINAVDIDGLPMAEKTLEEFLTQGDWNPYPRVRYTERPDVAAMHLFEGHVLVLVDTSPSVMIAPVTVFHHLEHAEEYRQNAPVGVFLRMVRYAAIFASLFILPLWLMYAINPALLPPWLAFIGPKEMGSVPIVGQVLIAEVGLDMLRMAAVHTPSPLATALGLIAAFMIGEVAIEVGLFNPEIILYLAVAAVGTFATPSYELGQANRLIRLFLIVMVAIFGLPGLLVGIAAFLALVMRTKSFGRPYFWPIAPTNAKMIPVALLRAPVPAKRLRPQLLDPIDPDRLPDPYAGSAGGATSGKAVSGKAEYGNVGETGPEQGGAGAENAGSGHGIGGASQSRYDMSPGGHHGGLHGHDRRQVGELFEETDVAGEPDHPGLREPLRWRKHRRGLWSWFKSKVGGSRR
ncbi:spore germination protein [Heliobacterium undosum]|uniref:Spore germination protein n=1 Tax=Heliomicrobium undosum TaxID=121734 RepID=A0A845L0H9_9FIRM|nr:spore germination protein [Heliomicrobium undosum]MZP28415.1 spore germination protein [Heliomicrobium undosum]